WWEARYRANVAELVERGLIDPARHQGLLAMIEAGPGDDMPLHTLLVGEAMMGVGAAMLAALDAGLGATVTACRPAELAAALGLPGGAAVCPAGVLALGWPAAGAAPPPAGGAPKPPLDDMYFEGRWGAHE